MILSHFSEKPLPFKNGKTYIKIPSDDYIGLYAKPSGFWLSDESGLSVMSWKSWCELEEFRLESLKNRTDFEVDMMNVFHLKNSGDIDEFTDTYLIDDITGINWKQVKRDCKGILITPYIWSRRLYPKTSWYYGWDCASGCFWDTSCLKKVKENV